jgi:photosystem II stability/assembly factor-like uncharacterized protein
MVAIGTNIIALPSSGSGGGIYRSTDNGLYWAKVTVGFGEEVSSIALSGSKLFAASNTGLIYQSADSGKSWKATNPGVSYFNSSVTDLAISTNGTGGINLFASTDGDGILISTDEGITWTSAQTGITDPYVRTIAVDETDIYVGTDTAGVFRSTDNGAHWTSMSNGLPRVQGLESVFMIKPHGGYLFASTYQGLFRSADKGLNWNLASPDLDPTNENDRVFDLLSKNGRLYIVTEGGDVLRSMDDGATWTYYSTGLQYYDIINRLAATDDYLFVAGTDVWRRPLAVGVFEEWEFVMDSNSINHGKMTFDRLTNGNIEANGMWYYVNNGSPIQGSFSGFTTTLGDTALVINVGGKAKTSSLSSNFTEIMSGNLLRDQSSGTYDITFSAYGWPSPFRGTYKATKTQGSGIISIVELADKTAPRVFSLSQNYPNPFNPVTRISFFIPTKSNVCLEVYDVLGKKVSTLLNKTLEAGNHDAIFNGANLSSGIYFYCIRLGSLIQTKKCLLLK